MTVLRRIMKFLCFVDDLLEVVAILAWRALGRRPGVAIGLVTGLAIMVAFPSPRPWDAPVISETLFTAEDEAEMERMMMEENGAVASRRAPNIGIWAIYPRKSEFTADLAFGRRVYDDARVGTVLFEGEAPRFVVIQVESASVQLMDIADRSIHVVNNPWLANGQARIGRVRVSAVATTNSGQNHAILTWQGRDWTVSRGSVIPGAAAPDKAPTFVVAGIDGGRVMMHEIATGRFVTASLGDPVAPRTIGRRCPARR